MRRARKPSDLRDVSVRATMPFRRWFRAQFGGKMPMSDSAYRMLEERRLNLTIALQEVEAEMDAAIAREEAWRAALYAWNLKDKDKTP